MIHRVDEILMMSCEEGSWIGFKASPVVSLMERLWGASSKGQIDLERKMGDTTEGCFFHRLHVG